LPILKNHDDDDDDGDGDDDDDGDDKFVLLHFWAMYIVQYV
jgi:hypothetical protein